MATPSTGSQANLRPDLAGAFAEFDLEMNARGYIASLVFPIIEVDLQADNPGKIKLEQLLFEGETLRSSRSGYQRGDFEFDRWQYATEEHGWEEPLSKRDVRRYKHLIDAELYASLRAMGVVMRNYEKRVADLVFDTAVYTIGNGKRTNVGTSWATEATATPVSDVRDARQAVWDRTGVYPNALVMNRKNFIKLQHNEQVIDRIRAAGAGDKVRPVDITQSQIASVMDVDQVLVADSAKNTAKEGKPRSLAQIWSDDYVAVCQVATSGDHREPCVGRTFHWGEDGSVAGGTIEQYYEEQTRCDIYRVRFESDEVSMYNEMSQLLAV